VNLRKDHYNRSAVEKLRWWSAASFGRRPPYIETRAYLNPSLLWRGVPFVAGGLGCRDPAREPQLFFVFVV